MLRLANRRSISTWSAAATLASTGVRKAATATEKASLGSFLFDDPRGQDSHPSGQRGGHVDDDLAGGHQFLGQEVAQTAGRLHSPGPNLEWCRPRKQLVNLASSGAYLHASEFLLLGADGHRGVRRLVGIDADHHAQCLAPWFGWLGPRRALLLSDRCARTSFEPHPRRGPIRSHFVRKPTGSRRRQALCERSRPGPQTLRIDRNVPVDTQEGTLETRPGPVDAAGNWDRESVGRIPTGSAGRTFLESGAGDCESGDGAGALGDVVPAEG